MAAGDPKGKEEGVVISFLCIWLSCQVAKAKAVEPNDSVLSIPRSMQ